jgi:hypothetical protein
LPACTSIPCGWNTSTTTNVQPCRLFNLNLRKDNRSKISGITTYLQIIFLYDWFIDWLLVAECPLCKCKSLGPLTLILGNPYGNLKKTYNFEFKLHGHSEITYMMSSLDMN